MRARRFLERGFSQPCGRGFERDDSCRRHLEDVDVVGDAIEQRAGQALGSQSFRPFVERQITGDQGGTPLVALRDQFEQ